MTFNALAVIFRENRILVIAFGLSFPGGMECRLDEARHVVVRWMVDWLLRGDHDWRPDVIGFESQRPFAASKDSLGVHWRLGSSADANWRLNSEAECADAFDMRAKNRLLKSDAAGQTDPAPQSLTNTIITTYLLADGDDLADACALARLWIFYARIGARDDRQLG